MEKEDVTESWTSVIIDYTYCFFAWPWTSYYVFLALCLFICKIICEMGMHIPTAYDSGYD